MRAQAALAGLAVRSALGREHVQALWEGVAALLVCKAQARA